MFVKSAIMKQFSGLHDNEADAPMSCYIVKCKPLVANIQELREMYSIMTLIFNRFESNLRKNSNI